MTRKPAPPRDTEAAPPPAASAARALPVSGGSYVLVNGTLEPEPPAADAPPPTPV